MEKNITKNEAANAVGRGSLGETEVLGGLENLTSRRFLVFPSKINYVTFADEESIWK